MNQCHHSFRTDNQVSNGKLYVGSRFYNWTVYRLKYTLEPKTGGLDRAVQQRSVRLALDGISQRQAARHAGISRGLVANWLKTYSAAGGNAGLCHYLTRLVRKSRCFLYCLFCLNHHLKAPAHAGNRRQLPNRIRPFDKKPMIDFIGLASLSLPFKEAKV